MLPADVRGAAGSEAEWSLGSQACEQGAAKQARDRAGEGAMAPAAKAPVGYLPVRQLGRQ